MNINDLIFSTHQEICKVKPEQWNHTLIEGYCSVPIFYDIAYRKTRNKVYKQNFKESIEFLKYLLETKPMDSTLFFGFAGILWVLKVSRNDDQEIFNTKEIKSILKKSVKSIYEKKEYELFEGLLGLAIVCQEYGLLNLSKKIEKKIYSLQTQVNSKKSVWIFKTYQGVKGINLGVPHGLTGILSYLNITYSIQNDKKYLTKIETLAKEIIEIYEHKMSGNFYPFLPLENSENFKHNNHRIIAWCYGDLINSYILCQSFKLLGDFENFNKFLNIAKETTKIDFNKNIKEIGICHGIAGISLIYHKFFLLTNCKEFKSAISEIEKIKVHNTESNLGLLNGKIGYTLSIISIKSNQKEMNYWHKIFLLN